MEHYLDNAATTRPCAEAAAAMMYCMSECYGNPSSLHQKGLAAQHVMDEARQSLADALGCKPKEILFTSGATECKVTALRGAAAAYGRKRKKIVISGVEHASVRSAAAYLEANGFTVVTVLPREDGLFYGADFLSALDEDTCLLSMMMVNNENGYRLPVEEVFRGAKRRFPELITHCDAVQGFLKIPFRTRTLGADLISLSGHKVHAAKGVGALFVKQGIRLKPILFGGHQESELRPGTESVPLIAAFGEAVRFHFPTIQERSEKVSRLRQLLIGSLEQMDGVLIRDYENASPYILNISLMGYRSEIVLHFLEKRGIYISSGSACSKGASSGVLEAFGADHKAVDSALRISFCSENTEEDVAALVQGLQDAQKEIMH